MVRPVFTCGETIQNTEKQDTTWYELLMRGSYVRGVQFVQDTSRMAIAKVKRE